MTLRSAFDPQELFQELFNGNFDFTGAGFDSGFLPFGVHRGGNPLAPTPALTGEAIQAMAAQSGATSTVIVSSLGVGVYNPNGFNMNLVFDAAATAAPASFRQGIEQAATILAQNITNKITVNIKIDYSGTGGGAAAGPDNGQYVSYSTVRTDLIADATPGDTTFNALPKGSTIQGQSQVAVWNAQLKAFGLLSANSTTTDDGSATFATDINPSLLVGVALHELTHAMGRIPYGSQPDIFDFYRFTSAGNYLFTDNIPAAASYFSLNGGVTKIAGFGQNSDPSDFLNSPASNLTPNDPFDEYYSNNTSQTLSPIDREMLDALGFNLVSSAAPASIAVSATASKAAQGGAAVTLLSGTPTITDANHSTLSGATIKIANGSGSAVAGDLLFVNGVQNGSVGNGVTASWNASTGTLTLTGSATLAVYDTLLSEVSYQDTGTDASTGSHPLRTVTWTANDGTTTFNTTSQIAIERAPVAKVANVTLSSNSTPVAASSLLTASDPDSDAIVTYAFKDTSHGQFFLNGVAQPNNQEIDVTAAQLSQLTYESFGGADSLQVRVSDGTLWSAWQSFTVTGPATSASIAVAGTASKAAQGGAAVTLLSATPTITDAAHSTLSGATIKIANGSGSAVAGDLLFVNGVQNGSVGNGVTASWNASTDTLTLTGSATLAVYDQLLSQVSYQDTGTDASTGSHPLRTVTWTANDGTTTFNTTSQIAIERAPVAKVANVTLSSNSTPVAASSLLTASDPDSDAIVTYAFKDTSHGQFFLNGVAQPNNQEIDVTAAQLSQLTYESFGGADSLQVRVSDGTLWSAWQSFTVTGPATSGTPAGAPSAATSTIVASPSTVTADGISTTKLTVTVEDASGHPVAGTAVTLSGSGFLNSFGAISGTTNANGVFTTTLASQLAQNETITATEGSVQEHTSVNFVGGVFGVNMSTGETTPILPATTVVVANHDTFLFGQSENAGNGANVAGPVTTSFNASSWASEGQFAALFHDAHNSPLPASFQWTNSGHDGFADLGNHDGTTPIEAHLAGLHSGFLLH